jgi:N-acetyl-gamma-glutamyl-phosphate reductase
VVKVGIVNVTGYAGIELARLLSRHPGVELTSVTGRSAAGQRLGDVFPHLDDIDLTIQEDLDAVDVAFTALPHHAAAEVMPDLLRQAERVIDISADYRLRDVNTYERWYGHHPSPDLLPEAVYGLPELYRDRIRSARLVANPGCYPTASILALAPVADLLEPDVIVDAKSGVSGAGRALKLDNHFCEVDENVKAYGLDGHRHQPEIAQEINFLRRAGGAQDADLVFVPHLIPMTRGILATCYARLRVPMTPEAVRERYEQFYCDAPFTRVSRQPPATKQTWGSNYCLVYPKLDPNGTRLIALGAIDNLVKGAAGQAVQNMNLRLGFAETSGLEAAPTYP